MKLRTLLGRSLVYYWRTDGAAALGVAIAVAVLAGALLVGDSVRATLRQLVFERLGNTRQALSSAVFFRQDLAEELGGAAAVIGLEGMAATEDGGRRAAGVQVWGVDGRFWRLHGLEEKPLEGREALASEALAEELGLRPGEAVLLTLAKPSAIPMDSLYGRKEEARRTIRLSFRGRLPRAELGEFSLRPRQGAVRTLFVPLERLQRDLGQQGRANIVLLAQEVPAELVTAKCRLEDLGIRLRPLGDGRGFAVESDRLVLSDELSEAVLAAARESGAAAVPVFTYLANTIRAKGREIPYSVVSAVEAAGLTPAGIALNQWAARRLGAGPGDEVVLEYYRWHADGRLLTESATFRLERILPMAGLGADSGLTPEYPGIWDSASMADWDAPFPVDLSRIGPEDEAYWARYRAAPKAIIALERGRQLWETRHGRLTSIRIQGPAPDEFAARLREAVDPLRFGMSVEDPRSAGLAAAAGTTDFGAYFTYFSFFLVAAALLLAGLFFRLSVEQRLREIGALRALGFAQPVIRKLFLGEALAIAVAGAAAGVLASGLYAWLVIHGLRTWWRDALGDTLLTLHVSAPALIYGAAGGVLSALAFLLVSLRQLRFSYPRALLAEQVTDSERRARARRAALWAGWAALLAGVSVMFAAAFDLAGQAAAFFVAGGLLLGASLCFQWRWLARPSANGLHSLVALGLRYAGYRPGRSILSIALIACAAFVIIAADSFRRGEAAPTDRRSGTGGFPLLAESAAPIYYDLNTAEGQESVNLPEEAAGARVYAFRLRPGDDASCLNLYRADNPRIVAPPRDLIAEGRFRFAASLARTAQERENPWLLLDSAPHEGAIPAIADANSLRYSLNRKLGDVLILPGGVRLRLVAALADSIFQSELIVSPENFLRAFPHQEGFRLFLLEAPAGQAAEVAAAFERALGDYGFDVSFTADRLAAYHRVENTYLSTFQMLGGLGLALGTAGIGAVLLRNVLERRRELALLRAVGYPPAALRRVLLSENVLVLLAGLATGALCALIAVAPAWWDRGERLPLASMAALLASVLLAGVLASVAALRLLNRAALLSALRAE